MVHRISLARGDQLLLQNVDNVAVFGVDHHCHAVVARDLHRLENGLVVAVKGRSFVGHEQFQRRHADFRQLADFLEDGIFGIHDDAVKGVIDGARALGLGRLTFNGFDQRDSRVLRREVGDCRRAAHGRRVGGVEEQAAERTVVHVFVHAAGEDVFPRSIDHFIGLHVQVLADQADDVVFHVNVSDIFARR